MAKGFLPPLHDVRNNPLATPQWVFENLGSLLLFAPVAGANTARELISDTLLHTRKQPHCMAMEKFPGYFEVAR